MNAAGFPLLSLLTFLPLVGAAIILFVRADEAVVARNARWTALWTSLLVFLLSLILWVRFDRSTADFQFVERVSWLPEFGVGYHMGVDGISVLFVLLSTALTPICILASWEAITTRVREYMVAFLVLETMMVGMFCALDLIVFYVFFEGVLIPMFLIIGVWGGARRVYAAYKFFLYTLLGSVLMLLAVLWLWREAGTTDIPEIFRQAIPRGGAGLDLLRLPRLLRGEGADVAGPHLAAGRACRGADGRLRHPRRRAAEDGRLRLLPLLPADAAGGERDLRAADLRALRRRRGLHLARWRWRRRT